MLTSRKFLILCLDVIVSFILHFGARILDPSLFSDVDFLIITLQPIFLAVIAAIAAKDAAAKKAGAFKGNGLRTFKNALAVLWSALEFRLLIVNSTFSIVMYFSGKYLAADLVSDVKVLIGGLQPVFLMLIGADVKEANAAVNGSLQVGPDKKALETWQRALMNRKETDRD